VRRTGRKDNTQDRDRVKVKAKVKAEVEENLENFKDDILENKVEA